MSNIKILPTSFARDLEAMLIEVKVAATILEAEAAFGPLSGVEAFAYEIRNSTRRKWRIP